ncbi:uncharacterized protein LOC119602133 [Lucilia sericata]|uniref:uncharacterized protein LOC119602133 n=1 Tax=Lucilia sericata TaxID=13632 RepID=UPI0018A834C4|nr:uncharacterized protein LOC119602133 [Lucilia sericata]
MTPVDVEEVFIDQKVNAKDAGVKEITLLARKIRHQHKLPPSITMGIIPYDAIYATDDDHASVANGGSQPQNLPNAVQPHANAVETPVEVPVQTSVETVTEVE